MRNLALTLLVLSLAGSTLATTFTPDLVGKLNVSSENELIRILITMQEQANFNWMVANTTRMNKLEKRQFVVNHLNQMAEITQADVKAYLEDWESSGKVKNFQSASIVNIIHCLATPEVIRGLMDYPEIDEVAYDPERYMLSDVRKSAYAPKSDESDEIAWGVADVYAPQVWSQGFNGTGVLVSVIDTGVNYNHVDLSDHMWNGGPSYPNHGWDFYNNDNDPIDQGPLGHGTHCAGSVASDGTAGSQCGVAPNATIMAVQVLSGSGYGSEGQIISGINFSVQQGVDIFSMSLGHAGGGTVSQKQQYRTACDNALAAGVVGAIAAGNEANQYGPPDNIRVPGNCPPPWLHPDQIITGGLSCVVTCGSTTSSHSISSFSSRGPVTWENISPWYDYAYNPEMGLIDPDISAPGSDIKSCDWDVNNGYAYMSGTSMATPHVAGGMALLLSKDLNLTPDLIDMYLETYAEDLGAAGKDNTFGSGLMNCFDAVNAVPVGSGPYLIVSDNVIDDIGGNNNGAADPGETCSMVVTLYNVGQGTGTNIVGTLSTTDPYLTITQSISNFPDLENLEQGQGSPAYMLDVSQSCPQGQYVTCDLHITADSAFTSDVTINFIVGDPLNSPSGPDNYGYMAYDPYDAPETPDYDWVEICADSGGPGTLVNFTMDDQTLQFDLPFTFQYYGQSFTRYTIATNGWIGMGDILEDDYSNSAIPDSDGPAGMIAPYWEDLSPQRTNSGKVWQWYDVGEHLLVVEYNHIEQYAPTGSFETFQVILLDPAYHQTNTGDGRILFQYKDMSATVQGEGTVGIENPAETDGLEILFDGAYDQHVHHIQNRFALLFTTPTSTPEVDIELTYIAGSPIPVGGGYLELDLYLENLTVNPINFDLWIAIEYEGGPPSTIAMRNLTFPAGHSIYRPDMMWPIPSGYAAGNYMYWGRVGNEPTQVWDESGFPFVKSGAYENADFVAYTPDGNLPDPFNVISGSGTDLMGTTPAEYALGQNHPNPFNPTTVLSYQLQDASLVQLSIYDISGRLVKELVNGWRDAGYHEITFDGSGLASGMYFYSIEAGDFSAVRKMVLVK